MAQIAICADVHVGISGRTDDIMWSLRVVREYCRDRKIDIVFIIGDLWHNRKTLEIDVLGALCDFFSETLEEYGQQWITFPGNHDMFLRHSWDINSLRPLRKYLTIIEDAKIITVDDQRFWVLPFIQYERPYMQALEAIHERYEDGDIMLTHIGVRNASLNTCFLHQHWSVVSYENSLFRRVYSGHFHSVQQVGDNLWYPGSLIPFKFDEGDVPHGFFVYDTDSKEHKFINIWKAGGRLLPAETPPPQFYTIKRPKLADLQPETVKNNMIRVSLERELSLDEKRQISADLTEMGAIGVRWLNPKLRLPTIDEQLAGTAIGRHQANTDFFRIWQASDAKSITKLKLDETLLSKLNEEIVHEGDEQYAVEEESE